MEFVHKEDDMRVPIKVWTNEVEEGAMEQAIDLAKHPSVFSHVALMPDTHQGYGMPIGGVIATERDVIPNAVGVDIGCGVGVVSLDKKVDDVTESQIKDWMGSVRNHIPVGFKHHQDEYTFLDDIMHEIKFLHGAPRHMREHVNKLPYQMCTLGGGNHFIELQHDQNGWLHIMVHSGSRNFGLQVAKYYHKVALQMRDLWHVDVPKDLAFLPVRSDEGQEYLQCMEYALVFARLNRASMLDEACADAFIRMGAKKEGFVNIHHNYASIENHFGKNVWVHRKGATYAGVNSTCLIPGSQGTSSYIGHGLGNPQSFSSCSHGAGRVMGRKQAIRTLDLKKEQELMKGIYHSVRNKKNLDESVSAYKDINKVMEFQQDLVKSVQELKPIAVIKG